jgi:hypothetical protein
VVLSFHVNYWDDLGWKDTFSSQASTDRQYAYARWLGERSVFTPQIVVNGTKSVVGSQPTEVQRAISASSAEAFAVQAAITKQSDGSFRLDLTGPAVTADIWEVRYVRHTVVRINRGENGGRSLEMFNNVTRLQRLGPFTPGISNLPPLKSPEDGLAVLVQASSSGKLLGAVAY